MWIIGDIHGCADELDALLAKLPPGEPLLFVGDYIDRGPDSAGVVERVIQEQDRREVICLMGNHESMLLAFYKQPDSREALAWTFWGNGGQATLRSYGMNEQDSFKVLPPRHQRFYEGLLLHYETEEYLAVHAGLRINGSPDLARQSREDLLWIREEWIRNEGDWNGKFVIYGHTPSRYVLGVERQHEPIRGEKSMGIDTGCVFGGSLTAVHGVTREVVQVRAARSYI